MMSLDLEHFAAPDANTGFPWMRDAMAAEMLRAGSACFSGAVADGVGP